MSQQWQPQQQWPQQQPQYPPQQAVQPWQPQNYPQQQSLPPVFPPGYQGQPNAQGYYPAPQAYAQQPAAPPSNAALIVILSFLVPGLGSLVGRSYVHGAIILAAFLLSAFLVFFGIGIFLVPCVWIWGMIAACVLASRR